MADIISGKFGTNPKIDDKNKTEYDIDETAVTSETGEENKYDAPDKTPKHKRLIPAICIAAIVLVAIIVIAIDVTRDNTTYTRYDVENSVNSDDTESTRYLEYSDGFIKYSNDGVSYYNSKGTAVWNQTVSMTNPQIKICHEAVAIGDINGTTIYVFDKNGFLGKVDTSIAISQIEVAKQGVVAAVLEDNESNYINLYGTDGAQIYSVKTSLAGDGYPVDISISDDATKLMASYLYVSGESLKTNVVFYNFSGVGQNEVERIVGGFNHYDSTIVGDVEFVNDTTAVAVGENVLSIYTIKEYPNKPKEISIENEIERVFFSEKYIGVVLNNSESGDTYKLQVYDLSGKQILETTYNMQYDSIKFDEKYIIMNNSSGFTIMNLRGKIVADMSVELPLRYILTTGKKGRYILINSKYVQNINLN